MPSGAGTVPNSTRHNGKKQPISPEQVIRLFGTTTSSSSVPTNYHYSNGGGGGGGSRERGRRSPASSPPSTTHQVNKVNGGHFIFNTIYLFVIFRLIVKENVKEIEVFLIYMNCQRVP